MNKKGTFIILLLSAFIFSGCPSSQESSQEKKEETNIVAFMPMYGEYNFIGQSSKNGIDLSMKDLKKKKIKITSLDDENNPEKAVETLKNEINKNKIKGVIVCSQGETALGLIKITEENKIPCIVANSGTHRFSDVADGNSYRIAAGDDFVVSSLVDFSQAKLHKNTAAIVFNNSDKDSIYMAETFKDKFQKLGGKIKVYMDYNSKTIDFSGIIKGIKDNAPEVIFIPDSYSYAKKIMEASVSVGVKGTFIGTESWNSNDLTTDKKISNSYFASNFSSQDMTPSSTEFIKEYEVKYNKLPDSFSALSYDAAKLLANIVGESQKSGGESKSGKEDNAKLSLDGVTGKISFDGDKSAKKAVLIMKINGGKLEIADRYTP